MKNESILERGADDLLAGDHFEHVSRGDSQEERCAALYQASILAHLQCALTERVSDSKGGISESERAASRRLLTSQVDPWRTDRVFLAECAGLSPAVVREKALKLLAPMIERERAAEGKRQETTAERQERIALVHHLALGGKSIRQGKLLRPKSARDWFKVALATGDDDALLRAAEIERTEHVAA